MRAIEISTDVYAKIWSHRLPGEECEDDILRRLLATGTENPAVARDRVLWRDDVRSALEQLGGAAALAAIYAKVRETRRAEGRKIPSSLDAIVRRELEYNSSDSESFTGKRDWFKSINGVRGGVWGLRGAA